MNILHATQGGAVMSDEESVEYTGFTPYASVPTWLIRAEGLSYGAKALYMALASYADDHTHFAFPGQDRLARDLEVSVRTVARFTKELEDAGVLTVTRKRNEATGNFGANVYKLSFEEPCAKKSTRPSAKPASPYAKKSTWPSAAGGTLTNPRLTNNDPIGSDGVAVAPQGESAQALVAEWLEHCDTRPPKQVIGQASRQLKQLLEEFTADQIRPGLIAWARKGAHPSALPAFVNQELNSAPPRKARDPYAAFNPVRKP